MKELVPITVILIRKATIKDVKAVTELVDELIYEIHSKLTKSNAKKELTKFNEPCKGYMKEKIKIMADVFKDKDYTIFLAEEGKKPLGYISIYTYDRGFYAVKKAGWVEDIYVKREYRGKNIASLLFDKAKETFRKKGARYVMLEVNSYNKKAISIYKKWGFEEDDKAMLLKIY